MTEPSDLPTPETPVTTGAKTSGKSGFGLEALGVAASRFFLRGAGFFSSLIIARALGADGRGLVSALTVPSQLAITISELGIRQSTAFHLGKKIYPIERLLPTLLTMVPIASVIGILCSILYFDFAGVAEGDWLLRGLAVAVIPLALTTSYATGVFLGQQRISEFRKMSWRPAFISLFLLVILLFVFKLGLYAALIAPIAAAFAGTLYALYLLKKGVKLRLGFDRVVARALQAKGLSYAAAFIILTLNYRVMILLLTRLSTLDQVGLYAQAIVVAELIWEIPNVLTAIVLSRAVNAKKEREFSIKVHVLARISLLVAVAIAIGIAIVAPYAFPLVFGRDFAGSSEVCIMLLPGIVAFIVFKILSIDLAGQGKPWATMYVTVPILFINAIAGWWAITHYAALGAAAVSSACYVLATVAYILLYSRLTGFRLREVLGFRRSDFYMVLKALPLHKLGLRKKKHS